MAHATAVGKVVLATRRGRSRRCGEPLEATPAHAHDARRARAGRGRRARRRIAEGAGEREPGLNAIAAPVLADDGRLVAVLGFHAPDRFDGEARRAAALPLARAAALLAATAGLRR